MILEDEGMQVPMRLIAHNTVDAVLELPEPQKKLLSVASDPNEEYDVYVIDKFGCDGFASKAQYQQRGSNGQKVDDKSCIASDYVPITMVIAHKDGTYETLWYNCLCNSHLSCRPLR